MIVEAIKQGKMKEYYGCYIIYPRRFSNYITMEKILAELKTDYDFYKIMDCIKAIPKSTV